MNKVEVAQRLTVFTRFGDLRMYYIHFVHGFQVTCFSPVKGREKSDHVILDFQESLDLLT
jgi:hypothetical protein